MNPEEQPVTPVNTTQNGTPGGTGQYAQNPAAQAPIDLPSKDESATLQAIEALESEEVAVVQPTISNSGDVPAAAAPVEAATSLEPAQSAGTLPTPPVTSGQTVSTPDTAPVEPSVAGVAATPTAQPAAGSQPTATTPATTYASDPAVSNKKKPNKLLVSVLAVVVLLLGAAVGYLIYQSM